MEIDDIAEGEYTYRRGATAAAKKYTSNKHETIQDQDRTYESKVVRSGLLSLEDRSDGSDDDAAAQVLGHDNGTVVDSEDDDATIKMPGIGLETPGKEKKQVQTLSRKSLVATSTTRASPLLKKTVKGPASVSSNITKASGESEEGGEKEKAKREGTSSRVRARIVG